MKVCCTFYDCQNILLWVLMKIHDMLIVQDFFSINCSELFTMSVKYILQHYEEAQNSFKIVFSQFNVAGLVHI